MSNVIAHYQCGHTLSKELREKDSPARSHSYWAGVAKREICPDCRKKEEERLRNKAEIESNEVIDFRNFLIKSWEYTPKMKFKSSLGHHEIYIGNHELRIQRHKWFRAYPYTDDMDKMELCFSIYASRGRSDDTILYFTFIDGKYYGRKITVSGLGTPAYKEVHEIVPFDIKLIYKLVERLNKKIEKEDKEREESAKQLAKEMATFEKFKNAVDKNQPISLSAEEARSIWNLMRSEEDYGD